MNLWNDVSYKELSHLGQDDSNSVRLYSATLSLSMDRSLFERLLSFVPDGKRSKILRFVHYEDAQRALSACLLSRIVLCQRLDCSNRELSLEAEPYGKPYVSEKMGKSVHFNLSHSDQRVVLAVDQNRVGIDIERVKPIGIEIAKRYFTSDEYGDLMNKAVQERDRYFYTLWTLKESYMKADGRGLSIPLDSFSFRIFDTHIAFESLSAALVYHFKHYALDDYQMAVCATNPSVADEIVVWDERELVQHAVSILSV